MNQLRNTVYHVIKRMQDHDPDTVLTRLRAMGARIGRTFVRYWTPKVRDPLKMIRDIYGQVVGSKVKVNARDAGAFIEVLDKNCSMCKYQMRDVDAAGCEIVVGMVAEILNHSLQGKAGALKVQAVGVETSRTRGNANCIHLFRAVEH